ncbi:hypothetical protein DB88DRAFT_540336 [Papiliotrema laurentii]|uniref:Uncharacterized protein n=1 Tax=Papiliotrema laurentii TaxID=5418 RepID=A0AAD9CY77_PAPLA|nr:hypothetical protein DB88DRAFT_540336 [Papiliotrema laurentii]
MVDWVVRNADVRDELERASENLSRAWIARRRGHMDALSAFASWLEDVYLEFAEIFEAGELEPDTEEAALEAVEDMLNLYSVDHSGHLKFLVRIRHLLEPGTTWTDWPCDVTGLEASRQRLSRPKGS